jgi:hypothetical protein
MVLSPRRRRYVELRRLTPLSATRPARREAFGPPSFFVERRNKAAPTKFDS